MLQLLHKFKKWCAMAVHFQGKPLYDQTWELVGINNNQVIAKFADVEIDCLTRLIELVKAVIFSLPLVTLFFGCVQECWAHVLTGRIEVCESFELAKFFPQERMLFQKIEQQKQQILQNQSWNELIKKCREAFAYAPVSIKSDPQMAELAITRNASLAKHMSDALKQDKAFIKKCAEKNHALLVFLPSPEIESTLGDKEKNSLKPLYPNGLSSTELANIDILYNAYSGDWTNLLTRTNDPFIYLKRKTIHSPHSLQIFKDGRVKIHVKNSQGIKSFIEWDKKTKIWLVD